METLVGNDVKTGNNLLSQSRAKYATEILTYADSELPMREIAKVVGCSYHCVRDVLMKHSSYKDRVFKARSNNSKKENTSNRKPKKQRVLHGAYWCWRKPSWYVGNKTTGNKTPYVFEHVLVVCTELQWLSLPSGYVVHHIDQDKQNNNISNLALMRFDDHNLLHGLMRRGVETIPIRKYVQVNGSASLWSFSPPDEDIVRSCWQQ